LALAPRAAIRQILGVRWVGLVMLCLAASAVAAPRASNPAFLGIRMMDTGGRGPCMIEGATRPGRGGGAAQR
jgi:hypothetical protein